MADQVKDIEKLTDDELRALVEAEMRGEPAPEAEKEAPEVEPEAPKQTFKREIDLGDGSGKEIFEADSIEALLDKIADAKKHASLKIRQQNQELKELKTPKSEPVKQEVKQPSAEDEFALSLEFQKAPSAAFRKMFKQETGMTPEEFRESQKSLIQLEKTTSFEQASAQFLEAHPEYYVTPANGRKLTRYIETQGLPSNLEGIEKAFADLSADGLLAVKPDAQDAEDTEETSRIAKTEDDTPRNPDGTYRRKASNLSPKRGFEGRAKRAEPTEEEKARKMTTEELQRATQKAMLDGNW